MADLAAGEGLRLGSGIFRFKEDGESAFTDFGEYESASITSAAPITEYRSNKSAGRPVVATRNTEKSATLELVLNTFNARNLAIALGGVVTPMGAGKSRVTFLERAITRGVIQLEGTNDEGPIIDYQGKAEIRPDGQFSPISEEYGSMPVSVTLTAENGHFGNYIIRDQGVAFNAADFDASV